MPECLNDQEGIFPGYYDPLYNVTQNTFEPGAPDIDGYLQNIAGSFLRTRLSPERLKNLKEFLDMKNLMNRNIGDPEVRTAIEAYLKRYKMAGKIIDKITEGNLHVHRLE